MKCETKHDHYVCECGKEFDRVSQISGHQANCKVHLKLLEEEREKRRLPNGMFKCENPDCTNEHDGSYGSGLFCSKHCRMKYIGKKSYKTRIERGNFKSPFTNMNHPNHKLAKGNWKCSTCGEVFRTKSEMRHHYRINHYNGGKPNGAWNKGLTAKTDVRVARNGESIRKAAKFRRGFHLSEETKQKLSIAMKKAHAEGRAHNIGESRWNNEPSWPEKWFMKVIANEFTDKNYVRERPFHRFSLDFAWEHKKKCIEIDGKQHETFPEQIERDLRKNKLLKNEGWQLLRLRWIDVYHEPQKYIEIAKKFIDE